MRGAVFPVSVMAERAAALTGLLRAGAGPEQIAGALRDFGEDVASVSPASMPLLRRVADELYPVFAAADLPACVATINRLLATWAGAPRLSNHDGTAWHVHLDPSDDAPWGQWLAASAAFAFAVIVGETGRRPGGVCAAAGCDRPFVDSGSGGERRYCSSRCASRARVAAHRAAQGHR